MTNQSFKDQMNFFKELASSIYVGMDGARIALVRASGDYKPGVVMFNLTEHVTSHDVITALDAIPFMYPTGYHIYQFGYAVKSALENIFPYKRPGAKSIFVAVTADWNAHYQFDWPALRNLSMNTQNSGVTLLVAGLDVAVDKLVHTPEHGIQLTNSSELQGIVPRFLRILCNGKSKVHTSTKDCHSFNSLNIVPEMSYFIHMQVL